MKAKTITLTALLALCTNYSSGMEKEIVNGIGMTTVGTVLTQEAVAPAITPEMSLTESICLAAKSDDFSIGSANFNILKDNFDLVKSNEVKKDLAVDLAKVSSDLKQVVEEFGLHVKALNFMKQAKFERAKSKTIYYKDLLENYNQSKDDVEKIRGLAEKVSGYSEKAFLVTCLKPRTTLQLEIQREQEPGSVQRIAVHTYAEKKFVTIGEDNVSRANELMTFLEESKKPDHYYQKKINALKGFYECLEYYKVQMEAGEESKNPTRQAERKQKIENLQKALDLLTKEKEAIESIVRGLESYVVDGSVKRNEEAAEKFPTLVKKGWCSIL